MTVASHSISEYFITALPVLQLLHHVLPLDLLVNPTARENAGVDVDKDAGAVVAC